jgi:predicted ATPase
MALEERQYLNPLAIRMIRVRKLFGIFDYDLRGDDTDQLSKVFILYGDNGSGKTTVLNLVFHLLSPEVAQNHRTFLAQTVFSEFTVELANGMRVSATRPDGRMTGAYRLSIIEDNGNLVMAEADLVPNEENVFPKSYSTPNLDKVLELLTSLELSIFYLSDDRTVRRSGHRSHATAVQARNLGRDVIVRRPSEVHIYRESAENEEKLVESAVRRAVQWIRNQYLKGSKIGQANANSIYKDIIWQIANTTSSKASKVSLKPDEVIATLIALTERNNTFSSFGLTTPMALDDFVRPLREARRHKKEIIISVLQPYLDGLTARLDALQEVQELIALFISNVNSFYAHKQITFNLSEGLRITSEGNMQLSPKVLSSGEKQLLLMFCNVLSSRDHAGIFIVDEPEISLNVKWQRRLLGALLDCTKGSNIQFLIASHSIEFIAPHGSSVVKLESI